MLAPAYLHAEETKRRYAETIGTDRCKWLRAETHITYQLEIANNTWTHVQMASVDENGRVLGILAAAVNHVHDTVDSLQALRFDDRSSYTFIKDMHNFIPYLFDTFGFRKINWTVLVGNPIERLYDIFIQKHNGRIIGYRLADVKIGYDQFADVKLYELFRTEYKASLGKGAGDGPT